MSSVFEISDLQKQTNTERPYHEFLRLPPMSAGVYVLAAGAVDRQQPHQQEEIYFVVRGKGKVRLGVEERPIEVGDVVFVEAGLEHRFVDIEEELVLLVVFAPAESS
jgi:mannose-6-phosphate isomerase-like protein (cupin superfamily)